MRGFLRLVALMLVAAPAVTAQTSAAPPSADSIMIRAARTYRALGTFVADFRQRISDRMVGDTETRGTIYQQGPNRFAMRYTDPPNSVILLDGTHSWIYLPEDNPGQVTRLPMRQDLNLVGSFLDNPSDRYRATWLREETVDGARTDVLELEPLTQVGFRRATIWIDRQSNLPRRIETDERVLTRTVSLSRIRPNGALPSGVFSFTVPRGVRIVEQQ